MREHETKATTEPAPAPRRPSPGLWLIRYGIGIVMVAGGIVVLVVDPAGVGTDGFAMAAGGGLAVLLLNALFRFGVSGDRERAQHEQAWRYFERHGEWPDESPTAIRHRREWALPAGAVTPEEEADAERLHGPLPTES